VNAPADLLANAERPPSERPAPSPEGVDAMPGYWHGSAGGEVARWRDRALRAENRLAALRRLLGDWRPHT
jgi:hypothetical protein